MSIQKMVSYKHTIGVPEFEKKKSDTPLCSEKMRGGGRTKEIRGGFTGEDGRGRWQWEGNLSGAAPAKLSCGFRYF